MLNFKFERLFLSIGRTATQTTKQKNEGQSNWKTESILILMYSEISILRFSISQITLYLEIKLNDQIPKLQNFYLDFTWTFVFYQQYCKVDFHSSNSNNSNSSHFHAFFSKSKT